MRLWQSLCAVCATVSSTLVLASSPNQFNLNHDHVPGQLLVRYSGELPEAINQNIEKILKSSSDNSLAVASSKKAALLSFYGIASDDDALAKKAAEIAALPGVLSVEANVIYQLNEIIPNDPEFEKLYGLQNIGKPGKDINVVNAWNFTTGSRDIVVGVIDTGIDYEHSDLAANIWLNPGESGTDAEGSDRATNGIDDDNNGYIDDVRGWDFIGNDNDPMDGNSHGTHVAGTIGAVGDNGKGIVGVNWQVSMAALKVFTDGGSTTTDALAEAISYATAQGMDLTSNSWGGGAVSEVLQDAISEADRKGIIFVAAAGNSSSDTDAVPHYPSSYEYGNIIAVASTDDDDELSSFSSYGAVSVDVAAPGSNIYSTTPGGRYGFKSGTSMATPHVAGLVALAKSVFPEMPVLELKERILSTSQILPSLAGKVLHGRIDAFDSLEIDTEAPSAPGGIQIISQNISGLQVSWLSSGDDGDAGSAAYYELNIADQPLTEASWNEGLSWKIAAADADIVSATLSELPFNLTGYLAIRAYDNVGNSSVISDQVEVNLPKPTTIAVNKGSMMGFSSVTGDWAVIEEVGNKLISDSPQGRYENGIDVALTTNSYAVQQGLILSFVSSYEIEAKYDHGFIEVSADGGEWQEIARYSGKQDSLQRRNYSLQSFIAGAEQFQLRFRLQTDSSVAKEGWLIDEFSLLSTASN